MTVARLTRVGRLPLWRLVLFGRLAVVGKIRQIVAPGVGLRPRHDAGDVGIDAGRMARRLRPALLGLGPLLGLLLRPVLPRALSVALAAGTSLKHATLQQWAPMGDLDAVYRGRRRSRRRPPILSVPPPGAPEIVASPASALR